MVELRPSFRPKKTYMVLLLLAILVSLCWIFTKHVLNFLADSSLKEKEHQYVWSEVTNATIDFETFWPRMQNLLCPNMRPNLQYVESFTRLAWEHVQQDELIDDLGREQGFQWVPSFGDTMWKNGYGWALYIPSHRRQALVYARIWKCGNDEIRQWMDKILSPQGGTMEYKVKSSKLRSIAWRTKARPCIVTAIRDPVSRFLSGYNEIEFRITKDNVTEQIMAQSEKVHTTNISAFFHLQKEPDKRFATFVRNMLEGNQLFMEHKGIGHVFPMTRVLLDLQRHGISLTAYLPTLKDLQTAWPQFVQRSCPNAMPESVRSGVTNLLNLSMLVGKNNKKTNMNAYFSGGHPSSSDPQGTYAAAKRVWSQGGGTAEALCIWLVMDYACWPALESIPPLCQRLYHSELSKILPHELWTGQDERSSWQHEPFSAAHVSNEALSYE